MTAGLERAVRANYGGGTLDRVLAALADAGLDPERLRPEDLSPYDSMHVGGWRATRDLLDALDLAPGLAALDLGCGLGGAARMLGARGLSVEAIDLTPEFVAAAADLTRRTGLDGVAFQAGSVLALPFPDASFDRAVMLHVGMNVEDKAGLFAEAARVLRPGGRFGLYDIMRAGPGELAFPLPWAGSPEISFVETPGTYAALAARAGLTQTARRDRAAFGLAALEALRDAPGPRMPADRLANLTRLIAAGVLAPVEMILTKPSQE
jgi:MPBQ/MSBQ methyltransferase